jgi:ATP-binding cassette subfamily G (WHITE) protein 2 (SNQ2)
MCFSPVVLGRPGSGCSTFLKTLANHRGEFHAIHGDVQYDSFSPETMARNYRGDLMYNAEADVHFPTLTVDETLRFATKMRAPHNRIGDASRDEYVRSYVDVLETVFGLRHVKDTPVGDETIRGVSGGEKKRGCTLHPLHTCMGTHVGAGVSIAEGLASRHLLACWDK